MTNPPSSHGLGYLPSDALERAGRRLAIAALLMAGGWLLMTALYLTIFAHAANRPAQVIAIVVIVTSLALAWHLRSGRCGHREAMHLGLGYELLVCFTFWATEFFAVPATGVPAQASWACVAILFFPALTPTSPRTTLVTSLAAVTLAVPAFFLAQVVRDVPIADASVVMAQVISGVLCSVLAYIEARMVQGLGRDVRRARQLGSYELVDQLGAGGAGEVWRARHHLLARPAAIKLIRSESNQGDEVKRRFEREAQITAALESPHTVELYDFGIADDGAFYYVMELLRGVDFETMVERFGPLPPARVVDLITQACDSLDDAHRHGLVHRDIKPANLFLSKRGRRCDFVKVFDFGLVKTEHQGDILTTDAGAILGTPAYLAPEMATSEREVGPAADIYGLGCVAYYLLTGEMVFEGDSAMQVAVAHATATPVPPSERCERDIPADLEELVLACLEKDPAARPASALELAERLRACELYDSWSSDDAEAWWEQHLSATLDNAEISISDVPTAFLHPQLAVD